MNPYKILFLDIDGTIVLPDDTIEESTFHAISEIQSKGIEVFLATGRPIHEIREIAKELKVNSFIGYNGAYAIHKGKDLFQEPMKPDTVMDFLQIVKDSGHEAVFYTNKENAFTKLGAPIIVEFIKKFHLHQNVLYSEGILNKVLGMTLINVKENEHLHYQNNNGIHLSQVNLDGMTHCYDVIRESVNKGIGVKFVLDHLGLPIESAIAFGDGLNDKEMLMTVGKGIAMGNAHPNLLAITKYKTTKVTESGIYNGLKMLGLV